MESMFLRQKYNYSKELKRPITFGNVDMNKAVENGAMLKCAGFMRKQTERYKTKKVQLEKDEYPSFDGKGIKFFYFYTEREERKISGNDLLSWRWIHVSYPEIYDE